MIFLYIFIGFLIGFGLALGIAQENNNNDLAKHIDTDRPFCIKYKGKTEFVYILSPYTYTKLETSLKFDSICSKAPSGLNKK